MLIQEIFSYTSLPVPLKCNNWIKRRIVMEGDSEQMSQNPSLYGSYS